MIPAELRSAIEAWSSGDPDPGTRAELAELVRTGSVLELEERFAQPVQFGTAGLRALIGAGPSRLNRAVVRLATAALAEWLLRELPEARRRGVVVARDERHMSAAFASDTAAVLAAAGFPAWVFPSGVPTPLAAFAVTALGAAAGVVITASHNPAAYNGYKVYGPAGAQIIPPVDAAISGAMAALGPAKDIPLLPVEPARARELYREVGPEIRARYLESILAERRHPGAGTDLKIVYTALHGVGGALAVEALHRAGFEGLEVVAEQQSPDPDFPTVAFPNPEEPDALERARALAERTRAELVIANDPDADRLAVMARAGDGTLRLLTGNEVGVLLGHYLLTEGRVPDRPLVMTTVVSSVQLSRIAERLGAAYEETLTGFKWIASGALRRAAADGSHFVFGYEEALGYAVGTSVRDKDGIGAAVAMADLAGWARASGTTVIGRLEELARMDGVYASRQRSVPLPGNAGSTTRARVMDGFRREAPAAIAGYRVQAVRDYAGGLGLPPADLLAYDLAGGARVLLRPSGTEPKLKVYVEVPEPLRPGEPLERVQVRAAAGAAALEAGVLELARGRGLEGSAG